ncbi:MAG: thiol reductant ABC exporter subunit CydC [Dehalococcoidia bacterium]|nr:thiol reductant ABC exporter subunit CydC [Dehalococcoidia bacterium]
MPRPAERKGTHFKPQARWLRDYLLRYKGLLCLIILLGLLTFLCAGGLMFISGYLISEAATQPENILLIYMPIVLTRAFGIARPSLHYFERLASHNFVLRMTSTLRVRLYKALEPHATRGHNRHKTGDILSILADDIEHIQNLYLRIIFPSIVAVLLYLIVVLALGVFSVIFALFMLLWMGIMLILVPLVSLAINGARRYHQKDMRNELYQLLTDAVLGVRDWLYSGRQEDFVASYERSDNQLRLSHAQSNHFSRNRDFLWQVFAAVALVAMLVWIRNLASQGPLSSSWIGAFVLAMFPMLDAFAPIPEAFSNISSYQDSLERINGLEEPLMANQATPPEVLTGKPITICLQEVCFQYEIDRPVLQRLNLTVAQGQKVAVLGPSGAGKSTLLGIIRGDLSPQSGSAMLNNVPCTSLSDAAASLIGVLNQRPYLFDTTIGNNIRLGNPAASDDEIEKAAAQAGLQELLDGLPLGINTSVEEAGARFSGGERQRIALARILLQKTPIVILDEPTIGLDPKQEAKLIATIFDILKDKTIIWVTHHLQGMQRMDNIIFMDNGCVALEGTHEELLRTSERYQTLHALDHWGESMANTTEPL